MPIATTLAPASGCWLAASTTLPVTVPCRALSRTSASPFPISSASGEIGRTIIPVRLYLNEKGMAKLEIALAKGKKIHDKREAVAERDWQRDKARLLRDKG